MGELATPLLEESLRPVEGWLVSPSAPGLGVRLNPEALRRHPLGAVGVPLFTTA